MTTFITDLWFEIFKYLPFSTYKNLACCSKDFKSILSDERYWIRKTWYDLLPWHNVSYNEVFSEFRRVYEFSCPILHLAYVYVMFRYNVFSIKFKSIGTLIKNIGYEEYSFFWDIINDQPQNIAKKSDSFTPVMLGYQTIALEDKKYDCLRELLKVHEPNWIALKCLDDDGGKTLEEILPKTFEFPKFNTLGNPLTTVLKDPEVSSLIEKKYRAILIQGIRGVSESIELYRLYRKYRKNELTAESLDSFGLNSLKFVYLLRTDISALLEFVRTVGIETITISSFQGMEETLKYLFHLNNKDERLFDLVLSHQGLLNTFTFFLPNDYPYLDRFLYLDISRIRNAMDAMMAIGKLIAYLSGNSCLTENLKELEEIEDEQFNQELFCKINPIIQQTYKKIGEPLKVLNLEFIISVVNPYLFRSICKRATQQEVKYLRWLLRNGGLNSLCRGILDEFREK